MGKEKEIDEARLNELLDELGEDVTDEDIDRITNELIESDYEDEEDEDEEDEDEEDEDEVEEKNRKKKKVVEDYDFTEDVGALTEGFEDLPEGFAEKAVIIFEAAVSNKVIEKIEILEEEFEDLISTEKDAIMAKVDSYLKYVVEEYVNDNALVIENGLRTEIAENFLSDLHQLFTDSYIRVPDSKIDLVDELASKNEELEQKLDENLDVVLQLNDIVEQMTKANVIREASNGLSEAQADKLKQLTEDVEYDDENFPKKIRELRNSYFPSKKIVESMIKEDGDETGRNDFSPIMEKYVQGIKRTL